MIKTCLFDLDGTLLNTLESIRYYLNRTLEGRGISGYSSDEVKMLVGDGAKNLIKKALAGKGIDPSLPENVKLYSQIYEKYVKDYDESPYYLTEPYDGIPELIEALSEKGIKLAVLSNKPDATVKMLVKKYFGDAFSVVLGASDKYPLKPDPTSALAICDLLHTEPGECAYFGDSGSDMKTGKNLGASHTVGVLWGFRSREELVGCGATDTAEHPMDILGII